MHNRGDEEFIASNSLQFFFICLFAEFAHPLTYLCVRNLTGIQVSTVFREGVTWLHRFGLNILATICDVHLKIDIVLFSFLNLKEGLQNITEKVNNPTCY